MCNLTWNVILCNMGTKLKQLWKFINKIFWVKTFLKMLKNNPTRRSLVNKCDTCWNIGLKKSYKNLRSFNLYIFTKNGKKPFDSRCRTTRPKVVLNDMCAKKKWWLKCELLKSIPLHIQKQNFGEYIYKHTFIHSIHFKGSCWGGGIELELIAKTWACKKKFFL